MPSRTPLPAEVRELFDAPNYAHLSTLRADGSPRSHVVWVGVEGDYLLVCTPEWSWKARDMLRDPRVSLSVADLRNPYRMAAVQGRVAEVRDDADCRYMNRIALKYTGRPWPSPGPDRRCFVIEAVKAGQVTLGFVHQPAGQQADESRPPASRAASA